MPKYCLAACILLSISACQPLLSQVCCVLPVDDVSTLDINMAATPNHVGANFSAVISGYGVDFSGNYVQESTASPGTNSCWYPGSGIAQNPGVNDLPWVPSQPWPIYTGNQYGDDELSVDKNVIAAIRANFAPSYSGTPGFSCNWTIFHLMSYSCNGTFGPWQPYWDNALNFTLYINTFTVSRGTASVTINQ